MEGRGIGDYGSEGDDGWGTMDGRLWMGDRVWESMVELKSIGVGAKLALARPGMSGRSMACRSTLQPLTNGGKAMTVTRCSSLMNSVEIGANSENCSSSWISILTRLRRRVDLARFRLPPSTSRVASLLRKSTTLTPLTRRRG